MPLLVSLAVVLGAEDLGTERYRAVTLEPNEHRAFKVKNLHHVTGSTGRCVREGIESTGAFDTFFVEAECAGVRTTMVWLKDDTRMHLMVCAEDTERLPSMVNLRKKVTADVKAYKRTVTACLRNGRVELWGWVYDEAAKKKLEALQTKYTLETVRSFVEVIEPEE